MADDPNPQPDVDPDPLWTLDSSEGFVDDEPSDPTNQDEAKAQKAAKAAAAEQDAPEGGEGEGAEQDADEKGEGGESDDIEITMPDGTKTQLSELELELASGDKLKVADIEDHVMLRNTYDQQMAAVVEERQQMDQVRDAYMAEAAKIQQAEQQLIQWVQALVPDAPDPALITTEPQAYAYQVQAREEAIQQANAMLNAINQNAGDRGQVNEREQQAHRAREDAAILREWPELADPQTRQQYSQGYQALMTEFGFTPKEIADTYDHRVMKLAFYAAEGMRAAKAKRTATTAKKQVAAKAAASKGRGQNAQHLGAAAAAIQRAKRPGATEADVDRALLLGGVAS